VSGLLSHELKFAVKGSSVGEVVKINLRENIFDIWVMLFIFFLYIKEFLVHFNCMFLVGIPSIKALASSYPEILRKLIINYLKNYPSCIGEIENKFMFRGLWDYG
jgi:hypothetical protein